MLTESAGHYAALAEADPAAYEVPRIDVLTRIALASDAAGSTQDAIGLLREVVGMYLKAPAADQEERDLGLARARFHLGRCLLKTGLDEDGLAETEAGLELAADVLDRMQVQAADPGWLVEAPRYLQLAAPDWAAAAVRAMTLHAEAGRWQQAATAARTADPGVGRPRGPRRRHAPRRAREDQRPGGEHPGQQARWKTGAAHAEHAPVRVNLVLIFALRMARSCSTRRLRERSTSASAEARSDQCEPSTDLPGSRSL